MCDLRSCEQNHLAMAEMGEEKELACSMCLNRYKLQNLETLSIIGGLKDAADLPRSC